MSLMRALKFRTGDTAKELSRQWGLGLRRVYELTAEASKRIRAEVNDPDAVSAHIGVALMTTLNDEMAKGRKRNGKVVADLAKTWATIAGAGAPTKVEHSGELRVAADVTPDAARRAMQDVFGGNVLPQAEPGQPGGGQGGPGEGTPAA